MSAACAELTAAAGQLRQAVADLFVSLADSWELGKKFSGEQLGVLVCVSLQSGKLMTMFLIMRSL